MVRTVVFLVGLALVVAGIGLLSVPAAAMFAGSGLMLGAWLDQRGELREGETR